MAGPAIAIGSAVGVGAGAGVGMAAIAWETIFWTSSDESPGCCSETASPTTLATMPSMSALVTPGCVEAVTACSTMDRMASGLAPSGAAAATAAATACSTMERISSALVPSGADAATAACTISCISWADTEG